MIINITGTRYIAGALILGCLCTSPILPPAGGGHTGSISFENGSYQSCLVPLVITVVDTDLTLPAVPVQVKSTADVKGFTVQLRKVAGATATYSDSVWFSIANSDSSRHFIKVRDGNTVTAYYADASPHVVDSASTTWQGVAGYVQPGGSPVLGVINKLSINVWDSDVTDSFIFVSVASRKDPTGFNAQLRAVAGSAGSFTGQIEFSLKGSRGDSVLAVFGATGDTLSIIYHDSTPARDITGGVCYWQPIPAIIFLDSATYHGTAGTMTVHLNDDDIADSTVVVNVRSTKDPAGISDTLHVAAGAVRYFVGQVGFGTTVSGPGRIAVNDGDTVVVSYQDDSPVVTVTQSAVWNSN
jgi:hypothetical protein